MKHYGCHNRPPLKTDVLVQTGWAHSVGIYGGPTREAIMGYRPDPMTKDCQHTLDAPHDPRCAGCKWTDAAKIGAGQK